MPHCLSFRGWSHQQENLAHFGPRHQTPHPLYLVQHQEHCLIIGTILWLGLRVRNFSDHVVEWVEKSIIDGDVHQLIKVRETPILFIGGLSTTSLGDLSIVEIRGMKYLFSCSLDKCFGMSVLFTGWFSLHLVLVLQEEVGLQKQKVGTLELYDWGRVALHWGPLALGEGNGGWKWKVIMGLSMWWIVMLVNSIKWRSWRHSLKWHCSARGNQDARPTMGQVVDMLLHWST